MIIKQLKSEDSFPFVSLLDEINYRSLTQLTLFFRKSSPGTKSSRVEQGVVVLLAGSSHRLGAARGEGGSQYEGMQKVKS
jgi:hypothetical protein